MGDTTTVYQAVVRPGISDVAPYLGTATFGAHQNCVNTSHVLHPQAEKTFSARAIACIYASAGANLLMQQIAWALPASLARPARRRGSVKLPCAVDLAVDIAGDPAVEPLLMRLLLTWTLPMQAGRSLKRV